ncbi:MAG: hypothetical protein J7K31_04025 [Candidatus Aenigmarchaeota archaeon]|nr:hypothetical protein [Candidatus Aenigmarchaeota archaeon]
MSYEKVAEVILKKYFHIKQGERLFVITDTARGFTGKVSHSVFDCANSENIDSELIRQRAIDSGPCDEKVKKVFEELKKGDCVFICLNHKLGSLYPFFEKGLRSFIRQKGARFASMTGLLSLKKEREHDLVNMLLFDTEQMRKAGNALKELLSSGNDFEIKGIDGTRISCSISNRRAWFNSGKFDKPGTGGNLPAGDVMIFPVEDSVNGKAVIDISVKIGPETVGIKKIVMKIENGVIKDISGDSDIVEKMQEDLDHFAMINERSGMKPDAIRTIAEFGIGLVPGRTIGINITDEKLLGVAHVANGNNFGRGGRNKCRGHREHLFWLEWFRIDDKKVTPKAIYNL